MIHFPGQIQIFSAGFLQEAVGGIQSQLMFLRYFAGGRFNLPVHRSNQRVVNFLLGLTCHILVDSVHKRLLQDISRFRILPEGRAVNIVTAGTVQHDLDEILFCGVDVFPVVLHTPVH